MDLKGDPLGGLAKVQDGRRGKLEQEIGLKMTNEKCE